MSTFAAGSIAIVAILVFTYLGFTKFANPFASPYTVHAVFASANGLRPNSFVRIAGVNVGSVKSVSTGPGLQGHREPEVRRRRGDDGHPEAGPAAA